jgi:hypothetical protein
MSVTNADRWRSNRADICEPQNLHLGKFSEAKLWLRGWNNGAVEHKPRFCRTCAMHSDEKQIPSVESSLYIVLNNFNSNMVVTIVSAIL